MQTLNLLLFIKPILSLKETIRTEQLIAQPAKHPCSLIELLLLIDTSIITATYLSQSIKYTIS